MTDERGPLFAPDEGTDSTNVLLISGEGLIIALERGYFDTCGSRTSLHSGTPDMQSIRAVTHDSPAGYPVVVFLGAIPGRLVPIRAARKVAFPDEESLTNQETFNHLVHPLNTLDTVVEPDAFITGAAAATSPPTAPDEAVVRLERLASAICGAIAARRTGTIGGSFVRALLGAGEVESPVLRALLEHRRGTEPSGPIGLALSGIAADLIGTDSSSLGPAAMLKICAAHLGHPRKSNPTIVDAAIDDLEGFVAAITPGDRDPKAFSPISERINPGIDGDLLAVINLLVMRPKLEDLLAWPPAEHGATEAQFVAAAYLVALLRERRMLGFDFRPIHLDHLLVELITEGVNTAKSVLPQPPSDTTDIPDKGVSIKIRGRQLPDPIGASWKKSQPARNEERPRPPKNEGAPASIEENFQEVFSRVAELEARVTELETLLRGTSVPRGKRNGKADGGGDPIHTDTRPEVRRTTRGTKRRGPAEDDPS